MELRGEEGGAVGVFRLHKWGEHPHQDSLGFGWGADETHRQIPVIIEDEKVPCSFVMIVDLNEYWVELFVNNNAHLPILDVGDVSRAT